MSLAGFTMKTVTQHDLIRELAISESKKEPIEKMQRLIMDIRENALPLWYTEQNQQPNNARLISISTGWFILSLSLSLSLTHTHTHTNTYNIHILYITYKTLSHCIELFLQINRSNQVGATFKAPMLRFWF